MASLYEMAEEVVLEVDEGLVKEEAPVEGTREVRMRGAARWLTRAHPGR